MVNIGTLFAFVLVSVGRHRAAADPPRPAARVPRAVVPVLPIAAILACRVADAQPDRTDLDPVSALDGDRRGGTSLTAGGIRSWPTGTSPRFDRALPGGVTTLIDNPRTRAVTPRTHSSLQNIGKCLDRRHVAAL